MAKEVADPVENTALQISPEAANILKPGAHIGDIVNIYIETKKFGRIAAQTAKQVIIQGIREAERGMIYDQFTSKEHEILSATVVRVDSRTGNIILSVGSGAEKSEALLARNEQCPGEVITEGSIFKSLCAGGPALHPRTADPRLANTPRSGSVIRTRGPRNT